MKFLLRAFAIMIVVNVAAILWMGLSFGVWNPANLDSFVRSLVEHWVGPGPIFWVVFILGLAVFETFVFFMALILSAFTKSVFVSTTLVALAFIGLVSLKAYDIQRSVKKFEKRGVQTFKKAVDQTGDALKDGVKKAQDTFYNP
jgi:membrane protein implicated in regulation of membrane protease activity